jgi:DNA repair exonuclease SbcCD ATPase subunit
MARRLEEMKRNLRGLEQGLKQVARMADRLVKKGIAVPSEHQSVIADLTGAVSVIKNATEWSDEVEAAMETIQERGDELRDMGPRLGMLEQWPRMEKQAKSQIARLEKALARAKKGKGSTQFAALVAKIEGEVGAIKARFEETKRLAAAGEFEDAMETFEDFFDDINNLHQSIRLIEEMRNVEKMVRNAERDIARFEKDVNRLEKQGKNVGTVRSIIAEGREKVSELKALLTQSDADPEDFFVIREELEEIRRRAFQEFDRVSGAAERKALQGAVIQALQLRRLGL